jgi:hypothetical protein
MLAHSIWEVEDGTDNADNPFEIPEEPVQPAFAKPVLFVILLELISQTYKSLGNFSSELKGLVYYDDNRASKSAREERVEGLLKKISKYFNSKAENSRVAIISTLPTLRERHGPQALLDWRVKTKKITIK